MKTLKTQPASENDRTRREDFFLVQRALCGEQAAYSKIYEKYINRLTRQVSRIVGRSDAEDVAITAIERAFERLVEFRPDRPLGAWLFRMANNLAIDHVRAGSRRRATSIDESEEDEDSRPLQIPAVERNPEEACIDGETLNGVLRRVETLPVEHAIVVRLKYINGLTVEEVAEVTGRSVDSVRRCLSSARKRLRTEMSERDGWRI